MRSLILLSVVLFVGCGPEFDPEWRIDGYRMMGVTAAPPEVDPDGQVELTVLDHDSEGRAIAYEWSLCLYGLGAEAGYACADPMLEVPVMATGPTAMIDFGPEGLKLRALFEAISPVVGIDGEELTLEDGFDTYVHIVAKAPGGREISTYKRVRVRDGESLNRNPVIEDVLVDDEPLRPLRPGETVELQLVIDEDSRDTLPEGGEEAFNFQWFTVEGELEDGFGLPRRRIEYTAPDEPGTDVVFGLVRDGRGGVTQREITLQIEAGGS